MSFECRDTIKRVAFPSRTATLISKIAEKLKSRRFYRMQPSGLDISSPTRPTKNIIDKTCPNPCDIKIARGFLVSSGAQSDFVMSEYGYRLETVGHWMQVSLVSYAEGIDIKAEADKP